MQEGQTNYMPVRGVERTMQLTLERLWLSRFIIRGPSTAKVFLWGFALAAVESLVHAVQRDAGSDMHISGRVHKVI